MVKESKCAFCAGPVIGLARTYCSKKCRNAASYKRHKVKKLANQAEKFLTRQMNEKKEELSARIGIMVAKQKNLERILGKKR